MKSGTRIRTEYLSVFSLNTGKYGPEKFLYLGTFHAVTVRTHLEQIMIHQIIKYLNLVVKLSHACFVMYKIHYTQSNEYPALAKIHQIMITQLKC